MTKPNPMGGSFAERKAAREGSKSFDAPKVEKPEDYVNTTFAERAKAGEKSERKAVDSDAEGAENKAVASKRTSSKKS